MNGEQPLPLGRFNVAPVKPSPYDPLGATQSYDGVANTERNRIVLYRPPTPSYNSAEFGRRASQEDGTIVGGTTQVSGGGRASFQLNPVDNDGTPSVEVVYGLINGLVPDNMNANGAPPLFITPNNQDFVYAVINFDLITRQIASSSINFASSIPDNTDTRAHFPIGKVGSNESGYFVIYQEHIGNINVREYVSIINGKLSFDYIKIFTKDPISLTYE